MRFFLIFITLISVTARADVNTLEALTGEWMELRAERAREAEAWKSEENRLRMELRLLADAEAHLQEELETLRMEESEAETMQAELIDELESRQARRETLAPIVRRGLAAALEDTENLPPPLLRRIEEERASADAAGGELLPRVRALLALHNQWLQLQTSLHADAMVLDLGGARREMDVLWIGNALAYAVNSDNTLAAMGMFGPDGWVWTEHPDAAARIRRALRVRQQDAPPALIRLPVEVRP
jgi:hypothetical protein